MMRQSYLRILIVFSLITLAIPGINEVDAQKESQEQSILLGSSSEGVSFKVQVPFQNLIIETVREEFSEFVRVSFPSSSKTSQPGAPELPILTETIAVPFGVDLEIQVTPGKAHTRIVDGDLIPVLDQRTDWLLPENNMNQALSPTIIKEIIPDETIYAKSENFPGKLGEISNIGIIRQQRIAGITLYPIQYNPATSELTIYESLQVVVNFKGQSLLDQRTAEAESPYYESVFNQTLLNYESSLIWRMPISEQKLNEQVDIDSTGGESREVPWMPPDPAWRIKVREDGFYQLTYDELLAAGLDVENLNPQTFQLFHLGTELAIHVEGQSDENFDTEDTLLFYGEAIENKYTMDNVYWLTYGTETGLRMPSRDVAPLGAPQAQTYSASFNMEINWMYMSWVPGEDDLERFLWDFVHPTRPFNFSFDLESPWDGSGFLDLALVGYTSYDTFDPDHHAIVKLNDVEIEELFWDGRSWQELHDAPIPTGILNPGTNEIDVILPGDTGADYDYVYFDWFNITYPKAFTAEADQLLFNYEIIDAVQFHLEGFSTGDLVLFDISDPQMITKLLNADIELEDTSHSLTFQEGETISGEKEYWAAEVSTFKTIESIEWDTPSDLQSSTNKADHITITHADFFSQAGTLSTFRNSQGLRTIVVDAQDIYDEFGYGIVGNAPIRDFLLYAYENWESPAPSFVVLVGDGHYNPKNYNHSTYGAFRKNYIPPYLSMVDPYMGETAADNRYVAFVGEDTLPDMMLGRLAVNSQDEAEAFIKKIKAYEEASAEGEWKKQVLAIADNADSAGNFPGLSQQLLTCCLPSPYQSERVYLGVTHADVTSAKSAIIEEINSGMFMVNYFGHGATQQWGGGDSVPAYSGALLETSDIQNLTNTNHYPIIVAMDCMDGYFINPHSVDDLSKVSLAEVITKAENKGAVASWSSTGLNVASGHETLDQSFFNAVFSDFVSSIGQATTSAKLGVWASGNHLELLDTYLLFGDPATNFQRVLMALDDSYQTNQDTPLVVNDESGVLANDFDPDGLTLEAQPDLPVSNGDLTLYWDGSFEYTPDPGFFGFDTFTYTAHNGIEQSNIASVTIQVFPAHYFYIPLFTK